MTARSIIAKGCIHPPKPSEPRPLAASVRLVRAARPHRCAVAETAGAVAVDRPAADTSVLRWSSRDG